MARNKNIKEAGERADKKSSEAQVGGTVEGVSCHRGFRPRTNFLDGSGDPEKGTPHRQSEKRNCRLGLLCQHGSDLLGAFSNGCF